MQGKGAIRFFAIALALACIYSLSFSIITYNVAKNAKAYANGDAVKERFYLDSIETETVYNLGFQKFTYAECKQKQINLGLDLKGGMNVTMEISLKEMIRSLAGNSDNAGFNKALDLTETRSKTSNKNYVALFGETFKEVNPGVALASVFATKENSARIKISSTDIEVLAEIKKEADGAIDRSFNILRTRIDKFGVTQPNIQLQDNSNRILIELPGVDNPERVRKLLQGSAKLEFWDTYENAEIFQALDNANKAIKNKNALANPISISTDSSSVTNSSLVNVADTAKKDGLALLDKIKSDTSKKDTSSATQNANFTRDNPLFAVLSPAIYQGENGQQQLRPGSTIGYAALKDTAKVNNYLQSQEVKAVLPSDVKFLWAVKPLDKNNVFELHAIKMTGRDNQAPLAGDVIANAREDYDQTGKPEVVMIMNSDGAKTWRRMTAEASKDAINKRSIAIVLDDYVYSSPTVQSEISGGISSISGNFTADDTKDLANILKAGKLPAPAKIVSEAVVGPSLGEEAINAGLISSVVGLLVVLLFMLFYYNRAGWIADLALFANVFFIMGVLASLGAVLTLPGIAGIVLTIGMAVDANVLIYERIREELTEGQPFKLAIANGYRKAYSSIVDSNVTTLLTGIILYIFGSGPIQGFATTLIIGIITSLFSAIFITRLIFESQIAKNNIISFSNKFTQGAFKGSTFDFLSKRKQFYWISTAIIVAGIVSLFFKGLSFGVDFKGGRSYVVRFADDVKTGDVREALNVAFGTAPEVKTFGGGNQVKVTTSYMIDNTAENADLQVENKLNEGLAKINSKSEILSSEKVGPTIADDIRASAIYSILLSMLVVFIYILIRFKRWQFGVATLVALAHDVLILVSLFSILNGILPFSLDIDQAFIAAVLTVMGYSINDTVVVFDRIREYLNVHHTKNEALAPVINNALNSTLSRTMITGLSTMFVLVILFIFGGEVIRGFSFAMLIGVIFGTYSSIFIATPIVVDLVKNKDDVRSLSTEIKKIA